jgi:hypothetical protein
LCYDGRVQLSLPPLTSALADALDPPQLRYRFDPVKWAQERAGVELWSKQKDIMMSVVENPNTAVKSCHSAGKSYISALTVCWWLDVHPPGEARAITTAPTSKQVDAILWYEIGRFHRKLGLVGQCNLREWYIGRQLIALGRKPPDHQEAAFQGLHAKYLLAVLDEAYGIPKNLWDEASSLASNEYGRQLAIGNPDGPGEFMNVCEKDASWNTIHIGYQHTPAFTDEKVSDELKLHLVSKRWVDERGEKWGKTSALFQSKCGGNFPSGGDPFSTVPYDMAMRCRNLEFPESEPREGGIDVGGGGDRTVLRERCGAKAGREFEFLDSDPMRSVGIVATKIREWGLRRVKVDSTGLGWGFAGRLKELSSRQNPTSTDTTHDAEIVAVNFGAAAPAGFEKKFLNMRSYLWWQVGRELSRLGSWDLTFVDEDVIHELTTPRYVIMDSYGKIKIEPKKEVIDRLGFSPDRAEALILAFYEVKREATAAAWGAWQSENLLGAVSPTDHLASW